MKKRSTLSLKVFLAEIERKLRALEAKQQIELILKLAGEVRAGDRSDWLARLEQHLDRIRNGNERGAETRGTNKLLRKTRELRGAIESRIDSIEDGSIWDDYEGDSFYWDDEDPEYATDDQVVELRVIVDEADSMFHDRRFEDAELLYRELLSLPLEDLELECDAGELRARFVRCVYENTPADERIRVLAQEFWLDAPIPDVEWAWAAERYPMLQDVVDASPEELPDWVTFLVEWLALMQSRKGDRAKSLQLEAIRLSRGSRAVADLVRTWGPARPWAYLYWLKTLDAEGGGPELIEASREALVSLPCGGYRQRVAGILGRLGEENGDAALKREGHREWFLSEPDPGGLRAWVSLLNDGELEREIGGVVGIVEKETPGEKRLLATMRLLAGDSDQAFAMTRRLPALGWSSPENPAGVLFPAAAVMLTGGDESAVVTRRGLQRYLDLPTLPVEFGWEDEAIDEDASLPPSNVPEVPLSERLAVVLSGQSLGGEGTQWKRWLERVGRRRVEEIVANKIRTAYDRAAEVLGILAEVRAVKGKKGDAADLVQFYTGRKYSRHTAFRREVELVVSASPLLQATMASR